MILIIGGAYQGKLAWAKQNLGLTDGWIDGRECTPKQLASCTGIHHFHSLLLRMLAENDENPSADGWRFSETDSLTELEKESGAFADWIASVNPDIAVISNELGCGIVPVEKRDRIWREVAGRVCTCLAARSGQVVRVSCGIGMYLKGEAVS